MKRTNETRVTRLETVQAAQDEPQHPPYYAVASEDEITDKMRADNVKIYVGVSPDDWD